MNKRTATNERSKGEGRQGSDPYNNAFATSWPANSTTGPPQDETVRVATIPPESHSASELSLQIAGLRVELARLLAELENLGRRSLNPGDLYAVLQIVTPSVLSEREKELYRELEQASSFNPRAHFG